MVLPLESQVAALCHHLPERSTLEILSLLAEHFAGSVSFSAREMLRLRSA
ncbi:hypothetical protein [Hymenobacter sp. IS2118]|nr:hypothetical protein [Hymenobacter sp. IS2118]